MCVPLALNAATILTGPSCIMRGLREHVRILKVMHVRDSIFVVAYADLAFDLVDMDSLLNAQDTIQTEEEQLLYLKSVNLYQESKLDPEARKDFAYDVDIFLKPGVSENPEDFWLVVSTLNDDCFLIDFSSGAVTHRQLSETPCFQVMFLKNLNFYSPQTPPQFMSLIGRGKTEVNDPSLEKDMSKIFSAYHP